MAEGCHTKNRNHITHRKLLNMVEVTKEWENVYFKAKSINSSEINYIRFLNEKL